MLRYALALTVLGLMLMPTAAQAQFKQGDWELTLGGTGTSDKEFETGDFSVNAGLGYFLTEGIEVGGRQTIIFGDGGSNWAGSTFAFGDWNFNFDKWVPFIGANIGYTYGGDDHWLAGPEAGVKYFLNSTTSVQFLVAYEFDLNDGLDEGDFLYTLQLGVRL